MVVEEEEEEKEQEQENKLSLGQSILSAHTCTHTYRDPDHDARECRKALGGYEHGRGGRARAHQ